MNTKLGRIALVVAIALLGLLLVITAACQREIPIARSNVPVYFPPGGGKLVVASGGEIEIQSGGTLDIQAGSTSNLDTSNITTTGDLSGRAMTMTGQISVARATLTGDLTARAITTTGQISTAAATHTGAVNMMNNVINNIGNAATDFDSSGGLALAGALTVTGPFSAASGTLPGDLAVRAVTATGQISAAAIHVGATTLSLTHGLTVSIAGNNSWFAHGMNGTPIVVCSPYMMGLYTYTVYISASNSVSVNVGIASSGPGDGAANGIATSLNCILTIP